MDAKTDFKRDNKKKKNVKSYKVQEIGERHDFQCPEAHERNIYCLK